MAPPTAGPPPPHLLVVDGNSLGHRAFHSTSQDAITADHAVVGAVLSMLATAWVHGPYGALIFGFDHPVNVRKNDHPVYKANRKESDPRLGPLLDELRADLSDCGLLVLQEHGVEADDLMAAAADACLDRGWTCDVLSSDRDLTALVTEDGVRLLRPRGTFSDLLVEDERTVRATYGIDPAQYTDLAALRGDPSDGLDGVTGIGPTTAARLLRDHGSVHGLYGSLTDLPPRWEAALRAARDRVERNLLLMAPIPHLTVDVEAAVQRGIDLDRVEAVLGQLGQSAAARRFRRAVTDPPRQPVPPPPSDDDTISLRPPQHAMQAPADAEQVGLF